MGSLEDTKVKEGARNRTTSKLVGDIPLPYSFNEGVPDTKHFERIVVPIQSRPNTLDKMAYVIEIAKRQHATVLLVAFIPNNFNPSNLPYGTILSVQKKCSQHMEYLLLLIL
jgi:hypothetical protein